MSDVQTTEFLRLIKVTFDISLDVLQAYTSAKLIKPLYGESFIRFLDKKKHSFYHKWQSYVRCCNCSTFSSQKKEMADWIFHKLYVITSGINCLRRNNLRGKNGVTNQHCLCKIISQQNISLTDLDVSAICFLLKNCGSSNLLIKEIDDIAKQRTKLCHAAKGTKSFTKTDYEGMWIILEQSILSLAKEIDDFYYKSVKGHLATIKKYDVDKADVIHHLNDIKEYNEKMKQDTTDYFQDTKNSILLAQEDLIAKGEKQSSEIQKKITETEANLLEGQQEILGDVKGLNTAFQNNASEIDKRLEDRTQPMHADVKKTNQKLNKITRKQIKQGTKMEEMSSVLEAMFYAQYGEIKTISEIRRHFQSHQTTPQEDMDSKRKSHQVVLEIKTPSSWSKDNINEKLEERLKKKEEHIEDDIELVKFEFKCLLLTTRVSEKLINDKQALVAAIGAFLKSIFDDCGIDTSIPETVFIIIDIYCPLKSEEQDVAIKDYARPYSSQKQFIAVEAKSKKADTHDVMDVDTTDFRGKAIKQEMLERTENILIKVENIQFNLTFKGLPYDFENDDTTSVNKETDYSFLGWTWDCPKHWDLSKIVSVVNDTLSGTTDWFQIDFVHIGASGKLEMQTCTQEHVFNSLLGLKSAVDTFLGKIVEACNLKPDFAESVSINVVYLSGIMKEIEELKDEHRLTSVDTKADDKKSIMVKCQSCGDKFVCENCETYLNTILRQSRMIKRLSRKLEDNGEQKDSDNDTEKEWETSSVDCQEPELKKRKTYQEDLTGDHQCEKVTTDLTSTEDSEISFDINETLKKLGKLKLIDFKINEGEKLRRKLERKLCFGRDNHYSIRMNKTQTLISSLKRHRKSSMAAISPDNLLQNLSYQRKQNAAGTKDLDFLDMNFGIECNFCQTQNKEDIPGRCESCSEILCNKCLVQHHVDHSDHLYYYANDILHGYEKTTYSFSVENALVDIKCLTIDTLVIVHMNRFLGPLTLSIYDLTGKYTTTEQTSYGDISNPRIAVIDPTTVAVSIPPGAVLIANYINPIINTKEIKTSPGMTGGIASMNNMLYLAYETGIKVLKLTGEEITSINIPDITLLYTVSNYRLLCVYNRNCGQSKTMGYIDIMDNSMLPLDKLPFHPDDVAVDNEGHILFLKDNVVWQAKSDGSDCKVIITLGRLGLFWGNFERVCFNAHSNLLILAGRNRSISVFRKVGDEID